MAATSHRLRSKDAKIRLKVSEMKQINFGNMQGCIVTRNVIIDSASCQTYLLHKARNPQPNFEALHPAYPLTKVAIKGLKMRNVDSIVSYIPEDFLKFYDDLANSLVTEASNDSFSEEKYGAAACFRSIRRCLKRFF